MRPWNERSDELVALFNPAFCGALLFHSIRNYTKESDGGMPFSLTFLILPFAMNCNLRAAVPDTPRTPFDVWCRREGHIRIGLADRIRALAPVTKESIIFLGQRKLFSFTEGKILARSRAPRGLGDLQTADGEIEDSFVKARVLGIMMARAGEEASVLMSLGLTL